MLRSSGLIGCHYKMLRGSVLIAYILGGVPTSPYIPWEVGLQVGLVQEYYSSRTQISLYRV
jgi:hypothetical protein